MRFEFKIRARPLLLEGKAAESKEHALGGLPLGATLMTTTKSGVWDPERGHLFGRFSGLGH